jgi:hypothetical protein
VEVENGQVELENQLHHQPVGIDNPLNEEG